MARQLDQILQELDAGYQPGRQMINERIAALPKQADAEISGLKAQEQDYFENTILADARRRGFGVGGIALGERAKYGASHFLPAVAQLKRDQEQTQKSLFGALSDINLDQRKTAMGVYQQELDREESARQSRASLAAQNRQFNLGGGGGGVTPGKTPGVGLDPIKAQNDKILQAAFNDVAGRQGQSQAAIRSDYNATMASANRGNIRDKSKIDVYHRMFPWLTQKAAPGILTPEFGQQLSNRAGNVFSALGNRLSNNLGIFR